MAFGMVRILPSKCKTCFSHSKNNPRCAAVFEQYVALTPLNVPRIEFLFPIQMRFSNCSLLCCTHFLRDIEYQCLYLMHLILAYPFSIEINRYQYFLESPKKRQIKRRKNQCVCVKGRWAIRAIFTSIFVTSPVLFLLHVDAGFIIQFN